MEEITIFDKIIRGEFPTEFVFENDHVLAFNDIEPQAPVHVLVVPKKKISRLQYADELSTEDLGHFMRGIQETAKALLLNDHGFRVIINNGRDGHQTVEYLHAHILGGRSLKWPPG